MQAMEWPGLSDSARTSYRYATFIPNGWMPPKGFRTESTIVLMVMVDAVGSLAIGRATMTTRTRRQSYLGRGPAPETIKR